MSTKKTTNAPAKRSTREERALQMLELARAEDAAETWAHEEIAKWTDVQKRMVHFVLDLERADRKAAAEHDRKDFL